MTWKQFFDFVHEVVYDSPNGCDDELMDEFDSKMEILKVKVQEDE